MPTQQQIADHLGMNQSEVSRHMATLGIDWKVVGLDEIRLRYIAHLRGVAAGHRSVDGIDLARERAMTEQVDRELKLLTLAEKKGQLVNVAELEPALARQYMAFKSELEACADKLKEEIDELYVIDVDLDLISTHLREALVHLSADTGSGAGAATPASQAGDADAPADDDGVGNAATVSQP